MVAAGPFSGERVVKVRKTKGMLFLTRVFWKTKILHIYENMNEQAELAIQVARYRTIKWKLVVRILECCPCPFIQILSRFYPDFIKISSRFYLDFILILSWFYSHFIHIFSTDPKLTLSKFYPKFWKKSG